MLWGGQGGPDLLPSFCYEADAPWIYSICCRRNHDSCCRAKGRCYCYLRLRGGNPLHSRPGKNSQRYRLNTYYCHLQKESTLGRTSDITMVLPSKTKNDHDAGGSLEKNMRGGDYKNLPPLGTAFEIISLVFLDSVIAQLIKLKGVSEAELKLRHTNIE